MDSVLNPVRSQSEAGNSLSRTAQSDLLVAKAGVVIEMAQAARTISGIAQELNILALNAALHATRLKSSGNEMLSIFGLELKRMSTRSASEAARLERLARETGPAVDDGRHAAK